MDRAYDVPPIYELVAEHGFTPHIRSRREEIKQKARTPGWRARRWVVERTTPGSTAIARCSFAGLKWKENHLAQLELSAGLIAFKRAQAAT